MDDIFNRDTPEAQQPAEKPEVAPKDEARTAEAAPEQSEAEGATAAPENAKHVPLAALEAERKGRQDWKEKAIRYEEELKAMRNGNAAQNQQQQFANLSPTEQIQQQIANERFNTSEMLVRQKYEKEDLETAIEAFSRAAEKNPALAAQLAVQRHPWDFAYQEGKRIQLSEEMGNDPKAYKERLRAEILAELGHSNQSAAPTAQPHLPQSLATARSSAPRGAPTFTGPTPFDSLFKH